MTPIKFIAVCGILKCLNQLLIDILIDVIHNKNKWMVIHSQKQDTIILTEKIPIVH